MSKKLKNHTEPKMQGVKLQNRKKKPSSENERDRPKRKTKEEIND